MNQRKTFSLLLIGLVIFACFSCKSEDYTKKIDDKVRAEQVKEMKWGMFICWSFSTFYGSERTPTLDKDATCATQTE